MNRVISFVLRPALLRSLCVAIVGLMVAAGASPVQAGKSTIAVLGLEVVDDGSGFDAKVATAARDLTEALRRRVNTGSGPYALAPGSARELTDLKFASSCGNEARDCMASIGSGLKADYMMYGKVTKNGTGVSVTLKIFDVDAKQVIKTLDQNLSSADTSSTELERLSKSFYAQLTGAPATGSMVVTANVKTGTVYVNGAKLAELSAGAARLAAMAEGEHEVSVQAEGYVTGVKTVTVRVGAETDVKFSLDKGASEPPPPPEDIDLGGTGNVVVAPKKPAETRSGGGYRKLFWGAVVVGAAAGGTWVYGWNKKNGFEDTAGGCDRESTSQACKDGYFWADSTYVTVPITIAAGAVALFAFYKGYISAKSSTSSERQSSSRKKRARDMVVVTPAVSLDSVGASMRIDF